MWRIKRKSAEASRKFRESRRAGWIPASGDNRSRLEAVAQAPFIEAAIGLVFGLLFFFLKQRTLAQLTWLLGPALSFSRYALLERLRGELRAIDQLVTYVDLLQKSTVDDITRLIQLYVSIPEPELRVLKDSALRDCETRMAKLSAEKRSDELDTGEYFNWLFPFLESAKPGSRIWAISMMLTIEWETSQEEDDFLALNLDAASRKVLVERIFVVPEGSAAEFRANKYIKAQLDAANDYLHPLYVTREYLARRDPRLLEQLGEGIIAVDSRVVLVDISSPQGFRGVVTMNADDIRLWERRFNNLRVYARDARRFGMDDGHL